MRRTSILHFYLLSIAPCHAGLDEWARSCWTGFGQLNQSWRNSLRKDWFNPHFRTKAGAEIWLQKHLDRQVSPVEQSLLFQWPRQGLTKTMNDILRGDQLDEKAHQSFLPAEPDFRASALTVGETVKTFDGLHERFKTDRMITAFRTAPKSEIGEPEVGDILFDPGFMNVSLEKHTAQEHGRLHERSRGDWVELELTIPRGYPAVPTVDHGYRTGEGGQRTNVSQELELVLKRGTRLKVVGKKRNAQGKLVLETTIVP